MWESESLLEIPFSVPLGNWSDFIQVVPQSPSLEMFWLEVVAAGCGAAGVRTSW